MSSLDAPLDDDELNGLFHGTDLIEDRDPEEDTPEFVLLEDIQAAEAAGERLALNQLMRDFQERYEMLIADGDDGTIGWVKRELLQRYWSWRNNAYRADVLGDEPEPDDDRDA